MKIRIFEKTGETNSLKTLEKKINRFISRDNIEIVGMIQSASKYYLTISVLYEKVEKKEET